MKNKRRLIQLLLALLACHLVIVLGAVLDVPLLVVLSCYILAVGAVFLADWLVYVHGEGQR